MPKPSSARPMPAGRSHPHRPQPEKQIGFIDRIMFEHLRRVSECIHEDQNRETILPLELTNYLSIAGAIAWLGPAALNAHRLFGVPASFLIAANLYEHGAAEYVPSQMGDRFPSEQHLVEEAKHLATHRKFRSALKVPESPVRYAQRLMELGYFDLDELHNVASHIARNHLFECDWRYAEVPSEVRIEDAAQVLSLSSGAVASLLRAGRLQGFLGNKDRHGYVSYSSLKAYEQCQLLAEIEADRSEKRRPARSARKRNNKCSQSPRVLTFPVLPSMAVQDCALAGESN